MNIEILRGVALSLCAATIAGLLSFLGLRRLGGIESGPVKRPSRRRRGETRLDTLTHSVTRYVPMSEKVADATRDMLSRSGVTMPAASFWAIRVASFSAGAAAGADRHAARRRRAGSQRRARSPSPGSRAAGVVARLPRRMGATSSTASCLTRSTSWPSASRPGRRSRARWHRSAPAWTGRSPRPRPRRQAEAAYSSRSEALLGLADRAQVNSITFFTASLVQAERAGSSLVDIIRMQAQSVRTERRLRVDDMTNKLSTKMLFPMLLLMLPSIIMLMSRR